MHRWQTECTVGMLYVDVTNYGANMVIKIIFTNATSTYKLIKNKNKIILILTGKIKNKKQKSFFSFKN